jgi:2,4-diaminopentanoate dehydrogenase
MTLRVAHWGIGAMGSLGLRTTWRDPRIDVVAVVGERPADELAPVVAAAIGEARPTDLVIRGGGDLESAIEAAGGADAVILATSSALPELADQISRAIALDAHVVCIAEEAVWPGAFDSRLADSLRGEAVTAGRAVFGTGINPGFAMDVLPSALAGAVPGWELIKVRRVNDLSEFGGSVLDDMGVNLTPEDFRRQYEAGDLRAHNGFPGSVATIANGLDLPLEIVEQSCEPLVRTSTTVAGKLAIAPGRVVGTEQRCVAESPDGRRVVLEHPQRVGTAAGEEAPHDLLEVEGDGSLTVRVPGGIAGGTGTAALMVNAVLAVQTVDPGLHTIGSVAPAMVAMPASIDGAA